MVGRIGDRLVREEWERRGREGKERKGIDDGRDCKGREEKKEEEEEGKEEESIVYNIV